MRKIFFYTLILIHLQIINAVSQDEGSSGSKIYLRVYGNYALPLSGSFKATNYIYNSRNPGFSDNNVTTFSNNTTEYKKNGNALGKGLRVGLGLGFIVSDFINLGLDVDYYMSGNISSKYISSVYSLHKDTLTDYAGIHTFKASVLSLVPNITYKAISHPGYYLYGRLGLMVGVMNKFTETMEESTSYAISSARKTDISTSKNTYDFNGGLSLGFNTAIGIQLKLVSNLRLSIEIQNTYNVYSPTSKTLSSSEIMVNNKAINGMDGLKENQKTTNFVNNFTEESTTSAEVLNNPAEAPKLKIPYISLGLGIGLAYKF